LCLGKPDFAAIEPFRNDWFFSTSLDLSSVPSEGTLRQRLDNAEGRFDSILKEETLDMIKRHAPRISPCHNEHVPLDLDVSPFDNSGSLKEGVSWTYKNVDGYAPMLAYLGEEGYWINAELREGSQHCQKGTPAFLRETIGYAKRVTSSPLLVRMDSGNDSLDNLKICLGEKADWLIKRNLRRESVESLVSGVEASV
ncbi:MAG: transposase, partial [Candidatus Omnitrophica bacterium]|nr:transposase [Candidatus Omnitrophota bacterium]